VKAPRKGRKAPFRSMRRPALLAFRAAVREVVRESLATGLPFYIWRDGRVVQLSERELRSALRGKKKK